MSDVGPTTDAIEAEAPIVREKDEVLAARREVTISRQGTLAPLNLAQHLEVAQTMAKAGFGVPQHLRGSPGACLAVLEYAYGWGFMAYALANKSYVVSDRLCFESQLIHAVVEMHAPLHEDSLNFEFSGSGDSRKCKVWAKCMIRGAVKTLTWESPEISKINPKNSPLWKTKPDLQLYYNTSRDWARVFFPHILMGAYSKEEMEDSEEARAAAAKDVSPPTTLAQRLQGTKDTNGNGREGFQHAHVEVLKTAAGTVGGASELDMVAADVPAAQTAQVDRQRQDPEKVKEIVETVAKEQRAEKVPTEPAGEPVLPTTKAAPQEATATSEPPPAEDTGKKTTRKKADPKPAEKPAEAAVEEAPKPQLPKTPEGYIDHVKTWIARATDDAYIHDRWQEEKDLRTKCGVIGEHFDAAKKIKDDRLREIGA
jgi:hypothetical protein